MSLPNNCTACHDLLGHLWDPYKDLLFENYTKEEALQALNVDRDCCRKMMLSSVNVMEKMLHFRSHIKNQTELLASSLSTTATTTATGSRSVPIDISKEKKEETDISDLVNECFQ